MNSHENEEETDAFDQKVEQLQEDILSGAKTDADAFFEGMQIVMEAIPEFAALRLFFDRLQKARQAYDIGQYENALQLASQASEMSERVLRQFAEMSAASKEDLESDEFTELSRTLHFVSISNLGMLHYVLGNYSEAARELQESVDLCRQLGRQEVRGYAKMLNTLALIHMLGGDYANADDLIRQSLGAMWSQLLRVANNDPALAETSFRAESDVLMTFNNQATNYIGMGRYNEARDILDHVTSVYRAAGQTESEAFALFLNNQSGLNSVLGDYRAAAELLIQAVEIYGRLGLTAHPDYGRVLNNLGAIYRLGGQYETAAQLAVDALAICEKVLGKNHPDAVSSLMLLGLVSAATGASKEALDYLQKAGAIDDRVVGQIFSIATETQRMAYVDQLQYHTAIFLSLVREQMADDPSAVQSALDFVLKRKAIGAEALVSQRDAVFRGRFPELKPRLKEWATLRAQIGQKILAGPGPEGVEEHERLIAEWEEKKERIEWELASRIPEIGLQQKSRSVTRKAIARELPEGTALIEFVRLLAYDFKAVIGDPQWKAPRYVAFILLAGEPDNVQMIDLGDAEAIDSKIYLLRKSITGEEEEPEEVRQARNLTLGSKTEARRKKVNKAAALRKAIFDPLIPYLHGRTRLFISPDGDLTRLPFEVLPTAKRRLIDVYQISYLSAGRDVLRFGARGDKPGPSVVVADPNFDLLVSAAASSDIGDAGQQSRDLDLSHLHFDRLPGTRIEGEDIATRLGVEPLMDDKALEASLKSLKSPRILHIATHGFFLPDQKRNPKDEQPALAVTGVPTISVGRLAAQWLENPLLRSGLALAGANSWLGGNPIPADAEDAILNAEDVLGLDLLDTELVVLSACETGLGEIRAGEGVFGLRRAFMLAGAKTLVMSLWKVPDRQTQELMEDFYERILKGQHCAYALREAQVEMKKRYDNPQCWGAFICQGDYGPISTQAVDSA
jgi:CHAT domain-containing protein/tetratricopeptide (TPR) repeat protein